MQRIVTLIDKFNDRSASSAELEELLILLEDQEAHLYRTWKEDIEAAVHQNKEAVDFFDQEKNRKGLLAKMNGNPVLIEAAFQKGIKMHSWTRRIAVAACVGLILLAAVFVWNTRTVREVQYVQGTEAPEVDSFYAAIGQRQIILKDSSEVVLYAGSSLKYGPGYNDEARKLLLEGRAKFTVKKNQHKPFMVYTKLNVTTALGTIFEVSETADSSVVSLLEGSVKVQVLHSKPMLPLFLQPGQKATTTNGQTVVSVAYPVNHDSKNTNGQRVASKDIAAKLAFKQTDLAKVLNALQQHYNVPIQFDKEELSGMLFTGTVSEKDSIETILKIIGSINNLQITANDRGFTVKK